MNQGTPTDYLHKEYPKQFAKTEFWKQIKRTVNGQPVCEHDINLIVKQIVELLNLQPADHLLDLGCGNGALASKLFSRIDKYTGVDFSEYLLSVAEEYFRPREAIRYIQSDVRLLDQFAAKANSANKVLLYGCVGYLHRQELSGLIRDLRRQLPRLRTILIGNIANANRAQEFFSARSVDEYCLDDPQSAIGVWWDPVELTRIGNDLGFRCRCVSMPAEFYGSNYRFDLVLENSTCELIGDDAATF